MIRVSLFVFLKNPYSFCGENMLGSIPNTGGPSFYASPTGLFSFFLF